MPNGVDPFQTARYGFRMAPEDVALTRLIAERIEAQGLSYRQLHERTGIPLASLHGKNKGTRTWEAPELFAIADALGVPLSVLVLEAEKAAA